MNARQSKRGKRISLQQEKQAAADLGGRTMAASGATRLGGGGDVRVQGKIRLECKFTEKDTYTLRFEELRKIRKQAFKAVEQPVLQFAFRHPDGRMRSYAVIPWNMDDKPKDTDHHWATSASSYSFTEDRLEWALCRGGIQFSFLDVGPDPIAFRLFEIMRWNDYLTRYEVENNTVIHAGT